MCVVFFFYDRSVFRAVTFNLTPLLHPTDNTAVHHCYYNTARRALLRRARRPNDFDAEQRKGEKLHTSFSLGSSREISCPTCWARPQGNYRICTFHAGSCDQTRFERAIAGRCAALLKKGRRRAVADGKRCAYRMGNCENYYIFISHLYRAYILRSALLTSQTDAAPDYTWKWRHFRRPLNICLGGPKYLVRFNCVFQRRTFDGRQTTATLLRAKDDEQYGWSHNPLKTEEKKIRKIHAFFDFSTCPFFR